MTNILPEENQAKRERTKLVLSNVYNLPVLPKIVMEVSRLLENSTTNVQELSKVISSDFGLVTKILTIANSPLYGIPRRVSTIDFAIVILGFNNIKNIITALSLIEAFKNKNDRFMNQVDFWTHAVITGAAAKRLAEDFKLKNSNEAFIAGILHDLGIPVIHKYFHNDFIKIVTMVHQDGKNFDFAENEILGLSHADVGQFLAQKWNFPSLLNDAIHFHHLPSSGGEGKQVSALVHLADYMTQFLKIGDFEWDNNMQLDPIVHEMFNLPTGEGLEKFIMGYKDLFNNQKLSIKL